MIRTTSYLVFFVFAMMVGWAIDSGYRSVMNRRWTNAGYFIGPICPIYGFGGLLLLFLVSLVHDYPLLIRCVVYFIGMSMVEFTGGLFSTHVLKVKLWDYSDAPLNILGQVDLLHSFYWLILALIFEGTVWPIISFLNSTTGLLTRWVDISVFSTAVILMLMALLRKMAKERRRVKPFVTEGKPQPLAKRLERINEQYEEVMGKLDRGFVTPSEKQAKEFLDRNEHYLVDLNDSLKELQKNLARVKGSVSLGPLERDLKKISRRVGKRRDEIRRMRKKIPLEDNKEIERISDAIEEAREKFGRRIKASQRLLRWKIYIRRRGRSLHPMAFLDRFPAWQSGWEKRKEDLSALFRKNG